MIVFNKNGDIQNQLNKKVDDDFLDKCRKSAKLFNKDENIKWTYLKAREDYIKECKNKGKDKISCVNCEFSTVECYTNFLGRWTDYIRCLVKKKYIIFEKWTAKNCKYYSRRED